MARFLTQNDMNLIFAVVDALGLSREAIKVPLKPEGDGSVTRLAQGSFRLVVPADRPVEEWVGELRDRLTGLLSDPTGPV